MSDSIILTINGERIEAQAGQLLIDVADDNHIVVPRFCYHKKLSVAANCRMCLVEIERSPKPMPACATEVSDGMVVRTRSAAAIAAQQSTMEFLLINHPLDCPVCDQGGECELQDIAMGFGSGISRYSEQKRVVVDKNVGPLIATDLTRCIHCTRCVRFSDEVAGLPEMGATGRGEQMQIGTYIEKSISSELSGNMIDICPVGALTAKPSRYTARPWELTQHPGISTHDCVGSNTYVHTRGQDVIRVVPRENESINGSWISDRDRFSYTAIKHESRLHEPMMRIDGQLETIDWETAIQVAAEKLSAAASQKPAQVAALVSPQATLEEQFLLQKLLRGLGVDNIDHRLTQVDFSAQDKAAVMPWLGRSLASLETLDAALIVAGNLRQEQPLLSHRLRQAVLKNNAAIASICHLGGQYNFPLLAELPGSAEQLVGNLTALARACVAKSKTGLSPRLDILSADVKISKQHRAIAKALCQGQSTALILGVQALSSPYLALIQELCEIIASVTTSTLGHLSPSANSAGACLAGCLPHRFPGGRLKPREGQNTADILIKKHQVLLNFSIHPTLDFTHVKAAENMAQNNDCVISINSFLHDFDQQHATLVLPLASFFETSGTLVNTEGLWQSFKACVQPQGRSRKGWDILNVLGQALLPDAFGYTDSLQIRAEVKQICHQLELNNFCGMESAHSRLPSQSKVIQRIGFVPIYAADACTRLSSPLQSTPIMRDQCAIVMNRQQADQLNLTDAKQVFVKQGQGTATLPLGLNDGVPNGCVSIPHGIDAVKNLSAAFGPVELKGIS